MAKEKKNQKSNVLQMSSGCRAQWCSAKPTRADFCSEHYHWFKAGLVTKDGEKPKDFDKKYQAFLRKQAA